MTGTRCRRGGRRRAAGFTLIEIMVVLAIIGLITALVGTAVHKNWVEARFKMARIQVRDVAGTIEQFTIARERCPTSVDELVSDDYLRHAPKDPWGAPLVVRCPGTHGREAADVSSPGPDGQAGTADDINSWEM
jgi:general secretion pathway protein G